MDEKPANNIDFPRRIASMDVRMAELLVCPVSKASLHYDAEKQELVSRVARLAYPIRDGVPILLVDEARVIERD